MGTKNITYATQQGCLLLRNTLTRHMLSNKAYYLCCINDGSYNGRDVKFFKLPWFGTKQRYSHTYSWPP